MGLAGLVLVFGLGPERAARACGGGLVSQAGGVGADAQRIFISWHAGSTDVITQIGVPSTTANYGVLIPVAAMPFLDSNPVSSAELDAFDAQTSPRILQQAPSEGGGGCGCGGVSNKSGAPVRGEGDGGGVEVTAPVMIGPVTATVLDGQNGDAVNAWLAASGFAIAVEDQPIVTAYAGPGRYFVAIQRSDAAAAGGPTSVGVHFQMAGDQRTLPLGFARLGASGQVSFTVFVAADTAVAPAAPFQALTLNDLDAGTIRSSGYPAAVAAAVAQRNEQAFVVEGTWPAPELAAFAGSSLANLLWADQQVTRLATVLPASALAGDVAFNQPFTGTAPTSRFVEATTPRGGRGAVELGLAAVLGLSARRRRR
jgi:hypothetical protein